MSRRKRRIEEKQRALAQLAVNLGDIALTSAQLGIPQRTLFRWRLQSNPVPPSPPPLPDEGTSPPLPPIELPKLSEDDLQALQTLKRQMLEDAYELSNAVQGAIEESTLQERVASLTRLVDSIYKLAFQLPNNASANTVIRYKIRGAETFERDADWTEEDEDGSDHTGNGSGTGLAAPQTASASEENSG